jgi:hypothetical protein
MSGWASSPNAGAFGRGERRLQQAVIAHVRDVAERSLGDAQQLVEFEEDHSPRRLSASA